MDRQTMGPRKVDRRLEGEPIRAHGQAVQPVARLAGFTVFGGDKNGQGGGGWLKLAPQAVLVRHEDGREERLELPDPTGSAVAGMAKLGAALAILSWAIAMAALLRSLRKEKE